jgi:hypothetical protein
VTNTSIASGKNSIFLPSPAGVLASPQQLALPQQAKHRSDIAIERHIPGKGGKRSRKA